MLLVGLYIHINLGIKLKSLFFDTFSFLKFSKKYQFCGEIRDFLLIVYAELNMALDDNKICTNIFNKSFGTEYAEIFMHTILFFFAITTILA